MATSALVCASNFRLARSGSDTLEEPLGYIDYQIATVAQLVGAPATVTPKVGGTVSPSVLVPAA